METIPNANVRSKPILLLNGRKRVKFAAKTGTRSMSFKPNIAQMRVSPKGQQPKIGHNCRRLYKITVHFRAGGKATASEHPAASNYSR